MILFPFMRKSLLSLFLSFFFGFVDLASCLLHDSRSDEPLMGAYLNE
jgi:hypothetical protein